jgi:hypothetical protein
MRRVLPIRSVMVDLNETAKAFRLFNEKADKLSRLSFVEKIDHPDSGVTITFENLNIAPTVTQERRGPDEEAIDAFLFTFRFFIQDNENSSFRNMEKYYLDTPIDPILQAEFIKLKKEINEYLDERVNVNYNNEDLTRRRIMDVFVYGGLAHGKNEAKRRLHKTWMSDPVMAGLLENEFLITLRNIHNAIAYMKTLNDKALQHLPGPS